MFHQILPCQYLVLKPTGGIAENQALCKVKYTNYFDISWLHQEDLKYQLAMIKHAINDNGLKVIKSFSQSEGENANDWYVDGKALHWWSKQKSDNLPMNCVDNFVVRWRPWPKLVIFVITYLTVSYTIVHNACISHWESKTSKASDIFAWSH